MTKSPTTPAHDKIAHGLCPVCHHYGDDCTGVTPPEKLNEHCSQCGVSVAFGHGNYVNRVPDCNGNAKGDFICADCDGEDHDVIDDEPDAPAHTAGPWKYNPGRHEILAFQDGAITIAKVIGMPGAEANAHLIVAAPDLLAFAHSAECAFGERLSCLRDELKEEFADVDDINDQIGNYEVLRTQARSVIAKAEGRS